MNDKKADDTIRTDQLSVQIRKKAGIERYNWLKVKYEEEAKEQNKVVMRDLTGKGTPWLEELDDKSSLIIKEREKQTSTDLFNDRLKRLEEHFHKDPHVKEQKRPIPRDITAERTAWLIDQCSKSNIIDERKEIISTDLVAGRQKKLEEQFHREPEMKEYNQPTSRLTTERAAWLHEKWKNVYTADGCHEPVSTELITGRLKWLEEQNQPISREERSMTSSTKNEHEQLISTGPRTGRFKWLREKFQKDPKVKKQNQALPRDLSETISANLTAERKASFEEKIKGKKVERKRPDSSLMSSSFLRSRRSYRVQPIS